MEQAWLEIDVADLYADAHRVRTAFQRVLADEPVDSDDLEEITRQLRREDVPPEIIDEVHVALGDMELTPQHKHMLTRFCPPDTNTQRDGIHELLITYQGHLRLLHKHYSKDPALGMRAAEFTQFVRDTSMLSRSFKLAKADQVFKVATGSLYADAHDDAIRTLNVADFVGALVRLASTKYRRLLGPSTPLPDGPDSSCHAHPISRP